MKNKLMLITLLALLLSSLFIIGCEEDDPNEPKPIPENPNNINPNFIDIWNLYVRTPGEPRDLIEIVEENYLVTTPTSITLGGTTIGQDISNSVFFDGNQIGYMDLDDLPIYLYDYYYNEDSNALWITENTTADIVWAVDPTVTDSVEVSEDVMEAVNIEDYQLLYRKTFNTSVIIYQPQNMSFVPNPEDVNSAIEGMDADDAYAELSENLDVVLKWRPYPGAAVYRYQLATASDFNESSIIENNTTGALDSGQTDITLIDGSTYYWRVKSDNSSWSEVFTMIARDIQFQNMPIDDSSTSTKPNFSWWGHLAGATGYNLEVSRMREFGTLVDGPVITAELNYSWPQALDGNTVYYWRVKSDLSDVPSTTFEFTTDAKADVIYPVNNDNNFMPEYIAWKALDNASVYNVEIATDTTFVSPTFSGDFTESSYTFQAGDIEPNTQYYIRVDSDVAAGWSDVKAFFTNATPILTTPVDGATNVGLIKKFIWESYDGASNYEIQVSETADFATTAIDEIVTEVEYISSFELEFGTSYFWRVQADDLGWNGSNAFTTVNEDELNVINLEEPANNDTGISIRPECVWGSNASDYYMFYLSDTADFSNILVEQQLEETSYTIEEADMLTYSTEYFWKVVSSKSTDFVVNSFTTRNGRPLQFTPEAKSPLKLDFKWNDVTSNEDGFEIYKSSSADGEYELIGTVGEDITRFVEFDVNPSTTYYYKARSIAATGPSIYTDPVGINALAFSNNNEIEMISVSAGNFTMGDATGADDEAPAHDVTLTNAFEMGKYEITNDQYVELLNWALGKGKVKNVEGYTNTTAYAADAISINVIFAGNGNTKISFSNNEKSFYVHADKGNHPVEDVTFIGAVFYANALSEVSGLNALYSGTTSITSTVYGTAGYRMPTEAEWEFAARNNDGRIYPWGNDAADGTKANYYGSGNGDATIEVTELTPGNSQLGLAHMAGNVWEWCNDAYDAEYYGVSEVTNPTGPEGAISTTGSFPTRVVIRGGSYEYSTDELRSANRSACRSNLAVGKVNTGIGFRLVKIN